MRSTDDRWWYKTGDSGVVKEDEICPSTLTLKEQLGLAGSNWHKTEERCQFII